MEPNMTREEVEDEITRTREPINGVARMDLQGEKVFCALLLDIRDRLDLIINQNGEQ